MSSSSVALKLGMAETEVFRAGRCAGAVWVVLPARWLGEAGGHVFWRRACSASWVAHPWFEALMHAVWRLLGVLHSCMWVLHSLSTSKQLWKDIKECSRGGIPTVRPEIPKLFGRQLFHDLLA